MEVTKEHVLPLTLKNKFSNCFFFRTCIISEETRLGISRDHIWEKKLKNQQDNGFKI